MVGVSEANNIGGLRPALFSSLTTPTHHNTVCSQQGGSHEQMSQTNEKAKSGPILDSYYTSGRKLGTTNKQYWMALTDEEKRERKFKRAYQRFMLGVNMPGEYKLLTLTTPENFSGDIHDAWRKFLKRMRRRGLIREYYAVKEWNKAHTCQHLHVVLRLDYIGFQVAREQWKAVTGAVWIHVDKVGSAKGMAAYLGKYLNKAYDDEPGKRSYWYAYEWIYRNWRSFSKQMFLLGEPVAGIEHEYIYKLKQLQKRYNHMNRRIFQAMLSAVREGIPVKLVTLY